MLFDSALIVALAVACGYILITSKRFKRWAMKRRRRITYRKSRRNP